MLFAVFNPATDKPSNPFELLTKLVFTLATSPTAWLVVLIAFALLGLLGAKGKPVSPTKRDQGDTTRS